MYFNGFCKTTLCFGYFRRNYYFLVKSHDKRSILKYNFDVFYIKNRFKNISLAYPKMSFTKKCIL